MNRFTIKVHTYSNNQKVYCPILRNEKDTYFITKDGKYPIPPTAQQFNSLFKQYGYLTMEEAQRTIDNMCFREESYDYNPIRFDGEKIEPFGSITSTSYAGKYNARGVAGELTQRQLEIIKENNEMMDEMFGLNKELENNTTEIVSKHKGYYSTTIHSCKKCNTEILRTSYNFCPNCGKKIVNK